MDRSPTSRSQADTASDATSPAQLDTTTILNTVGDGTIQLTPDGYIVSISEALAELAGHTPEELEGRHVSKFLDPETIAHTQAAVQKRLLNGSEETLTLSFPVYPETGDVVPCEARLSIVFDDGEFTGIVAVVREVTDREQAAEIRETSERRHAFDALAQASADGIITLDDESVIRYANPAVERILGYSPTELVGSSKMKIIPDRLREAHAEALERYLDTGEKHVDWTYVELPGLHKDGHEVPLAISLNEFEHEGEHYFVGTFRDISKRKQAEQELQQSEQRYRALVEASTNIVWRTNADGEFDTEQPEWSKYTGQTYEEYEGFGWLDVIHPEDRDWVQSQWLQSIEKTTPIECEYRIRHQDGKWHWVSDRAAPVLENDGSVREWVGAHTDITEQKEYEQALTALHDASRELLDATSRTEVSQIVVDTVVNVLDIPGVSIYLYDEAKEVLKPAATSQSLQDLIGEMPLFSGDETSIMWQAFSDGDTFTFDDVRATDLTYTIDTPLRSGMWIPLDDNGVLAIVSDEVSAFDDEAHQLADLLAATAEAALKRTDREQRLQRQNERLESFASMLAHELRNPLTIAQIYTRQAQTGDADALEEVTAALDRIDSMIDVLLILARSNNAVSAGEPVDLTTVVDDAWSHIAPEDAELTVDTSQTIRADSNHLQHLFRNLFQNAVEHGGPDVTIRVGELPDGFYVEDDGPGVPADKRETVFEAGYSGKDNGTGLGLTFIAHLADAYGWSYTLTSNDDGGARFEFENLTQTSAVTD